ncbi:hypothetical protein FEI13_08225 [Halomonas urmiana]|uniref:Uncharacterized protein n=1 Tax=Halomonas urmiana TaxID=490901 RepID=A0A5R8MI41_9GAMM|nr:hypothetical protein [Halomonas urmiana]TLF51645.1 hypothetical protein FEI13_08225 [Halomonas urmiana]
MINTTSNIVVLKDGESLCESIRQAIEETIDILKSNYKIEGYVSPNDITSGRNNQFKELAFIRYIAPFQKKRHTKEWLINFYPFVCGTGRRGHVSEGDPVNLAGLVNESISKTLCNPVIRGMRYFYLSLWRKKAVLLTMEFKLPSIQKDQDAGRLLYSELLYSVRTPGMKGEVDESKSLIPYLKHTAYRNVYWYYWKPVVASDWHVIEDVNNTDLKKYFNEMAKRIEQGAGEKTTYPVSSTGFLGVLYKKYGERCRFEFDKVSKYNPRAERDVKDLRFEIETFSSSTDYAGQKEVWLKLEQSYINLIEKGFSKGKVKLANQSLSKLNRYLFSILPKEECSPPYPKNFDRKYLDGVDVPSIRDSVINKGNLFINLDQFFTHVESVSEAYDNVRGFNNPLLDIDKPRERKRQTTNKKTFTIDDFRFIYELSYCISEVSWYINSVISNGAFEEELEGGASFRANGLNSVEDLVNIDVLHEELGLTSNTEKNLIIYRRAFSNLFEDMLKMHRNRSVVDMEDFGYVPFISYCRLSDEKEVMVPIRFIPTRLLKIVSVLLKGKKRYTPFLAMQNINQVVTALETGLRHITVRWLDKRKYKHGAVDVKSKYFNLYVNSDKVSRAWVRPTSKKLLEILERQVDSHRWFDEDHVNFLINYNNERVTRHGRVSPIFIRYDKKEVYGEHVASEYYNVLMFYVSILKKMIGEDPIDELHLEKDNPNFDKKKDFEFALRKLKNFSSGYTPHGTRASVVSIMSTVLPADIIGKFITGHVSVDTVKYYTVVNIETMQQMGLIDSVELDGRIEKVMAMMTPIRINADRKDSKIRKLLTHGNDSIASVLNDFGSCSFSMEAGEQYISGVEEMERVDRSRLAFLPTHICPLENECPNSIRTSIGEKQCGQCPYSVKTVDHLTGIQAKCRYLARELDSKKKVMRKHKEKNGAVETSELMQSQYMKVASELAAWTLTEKMLRENYEKLKNKVLVNKPEMLKSVVEEKSAPSDWLGRLLLECDEATTYPDLANSTLEAHVLRCRTKIVSSKVRLEEYYGKDDDFDLVEGFRHHVRAVCLSSGKTPDELVRFLENNKSKALEKSTFQSSQLLPAYKN